MGQGERVVQPGGRGQRDLLGRGVVLPPAAPVEERAERPGDLPGVGVEVAGVGEGDQREQHRDLGVEPGHRLVLVRHVGGQHARLRPGQLQRRPERAEPVGGRHRGVQVVVQHPVRRGPALGLRVVSFGLVGRVRTEQVVEREPGRQVLGHHVGPDQLAQRGARGGPRHPGQAGRRRQRDVRARVHAEQAEHPRRGLGELVVGPGEHGPHVGHRVAGLQCVEPAPRVVQLGGELGQRALGPPRRPAGRDAQGQREAGAGGDDLVRGTGFGRDAGPAEPAGEHLVRLGVAEHVEGERNRAFGRDQPGQLVAAWSPRPASPARRAAAAAPGRRCARCPGRSASACRRAGCGTARNGPRCRPGSGAAARPAHRGTSAAPRPAPSAGWPGRDRAG